MHTGPRIVPVDSGWNELISRRDQWLKSIEGARQELDIDNPLDCGLKVPRSDLLEKFDPIDLADLCGISRFQWIDADKDADKPEVEDLRSESRCERSWKRDGTVKHRRDGGMLSDRDAAALGLD